MKDLFALMNPTRWAVLAGVAAGLMLVLSGIGWKVYDTGKAAGLAELERYMLQQSTATNRSLIVQAERIGLLQAINEGVQRDLNAVDAELASVLSVRAAGGGLRDKDRAAIVAAASGAAAQACGRYADAAERDIAGLEDDATAMAARAVRASAVAHALQLTMQRRELTRDQLRAQRDQLRTEP